MRHMNCKSIYLHISAITLLLLSSLSGFAQQPPVTKVSGVITDAKTKQTLPFVNVFAGDSTVNTTSDEDGKYTLQSTKSFSQIKVSYVGYRPITLNVVAGQEQVV